MLEITSENFENFIMKDRALIEIYTQGCPPCKVMKEKILPQIESKIAVGVFNANNNAFLLNRFMEDCGSFTSVPLILYYKNGEFQKRHNGAMPLKDLEDFIEDEEL